MLWLLIIGGSWLLLAAICCVPVSRLLRRAGEAAVPLPQVRPPAASDPVEWIGDRRRSGRSSIG